MGGRVIRVSDEAKRLLGALWAPDGEVLRLLPPRCPTAGQGGSMVARPPPQPEGGGRQDHPYRTQRRLMHPSRSRCTDASSARVGGET